MVQIHGPQILAKFEVREICFRSAHPHYHVDMASRLSPGKGEEGEEDTIMGCVIYTTVYSSPVCKNLSSKLDRFLPVRSQFDTNHRVHFSTPTSCQSATFGPLFAFYCPLFFYENK